MIKRCLFTFILVGFLGLSCALSPFIQSSEDGSTLPEILLGLSTSTPSPTPLPTPTSTPIPIVRIHQADNLYFIGDFEGAMREYLAVLNSAGEPDLQAAALIGMGKANYALGNYLGAIQALLTLTETYPDSSHLAHAHFILGQSYAAIEDYPRAAESYQRYLDLNPGVLDAYVQEQRGDALSAIGRYQEAIAAYEAAYNAPQLGDPANLQIKIGKAYTALGDYENAIRIFMSIYESTNNDYTKAQMNLLAGQAYLALGIPEQAYARFQESVNSFPLSYDSYSALVALVNAGQPVDDYNRGVVDYYARQYGVAIDAFDRFMASNPGHDGSALHYKALSQRAMGDYQEAIAAWNYLIENYSENRFWASAWDEKAYTQWVYLNQYSQAAETLLGFVRLRPTAAEAPTFLFEAGRIYERNNQLKEAAATWGRIIDEYPAAEISYRALFLSAITFYRLGEYTQALINFQRNLALAVNPGDIAAANFWIGKTLAEMNNADGAKAAWEQAAKSDPTGYYSERARERLVNLPPLTAAPLYDLEYNLEEERRLAELWLRSNFEIPSVTDLSQLGPLADDPRLLRGDEFWELGLYSQASAEYDALRTAILQDPVNNFRLLNHLLERGFYRQAILISRQILNLANLDDAGTFTAPAYFNHIRFGAYFKELIVPLAENAGFHPLLMFSVIRQESLFDGFARSSSDARGLMQIIPSTGQEVASQLNWPSGYTAKDLYRPIVNINFGIHYLMRQRNYFEGDLYAALAAYNGGPGNAYTWRSLAPNDPDLFLEVIRFDETRRYIIQIAEFMHIYRRLYEKEP